MNKNRTSSEVDSIYADYPRTFVKLQKYLDENNNGIDSKELVTKITKYCKMAIHTAHKQIGNDKMMENNVSIDLYTIDLIIDSDFKPWIIKFKNAKSIQNPTNIVKKKLNIDHYEGARKLVDRLVKDINSKDGDKE